MNFNHWEHCTSGCAVKNCFQNLLHKEFGSHSDILKDLFLDNLSVFSFVWVETPPDFSDLSIYWPFPAWPMASFLWDSVPSSDKISLYKILTSYPGRYKFNSVYFLATRISSDSPVHSAHILHFYRGITEVRCTHEFQFTESDFDLGQFLSGIVRHAPVETEFSCRQDVLFSALFVHESSLFARRLYFFIALAFSYPYFGGMSAIFSNLKVEIAYDCLWLEIIPLIVGIVSCKTVLDDIHFLCQQTEFYSKVKDENYVKNVLRTFIDSEINLDLPMVSSILERFLFPYFSNADSPTDIFSAGSINQILLSKHICKAIAEYHPGVLKNLLESSHHVQWVLKHLFHMQALLGDLCIVNRWISRSFQLYRHCLDQLGHFEPVLPSNVFGSGGKDNDIDHQVEVFERPIAASMQVNLVPSLGSLASQVARLRIRQSILAMPLPRPSFCALLDSLPNLSLSIKRFIRIDDD